jgi:hypothetical protein
VDDSGYGGNEDYVVTNATVTIGRSPDFSVTYNGIGALTLNGGSGSDIFDLDSTAVGTTVNAGPGGNIFHVSPFTQYLAASIIGPLTLNGGGADILEFFDANDPNSETFSFDPVPMSLTLGSTGTDITDFFGMGGGIYVQTNGFSTPDDQSGTVIFDGLPPFGQGGGPPARSGSTYQLLTEEGARMTGVEAVSKQAMGASDATRGVHARAPALLDGLFGEATDQADLIDKVFSW